jgi:hypothetical protein
MPQAARREGGELIEEITKVCLDCEKSFKPTDQEHVVCPICVEAAMKASWKEATTFQHGDGCNANCWCWT